MMKNLLQRNNMGTNIGTIRNIYRNNMGTNIGTIRNIYRNNMGTNMGKSGTYIGTIWERI
ncbi:hypothetical protein AVI50_16860 (plasmid) [Piscirickettsia salmonis]|nr:hypothetical protein AVI50_16860 [Piscirickettsia salmonis]